MKYTVIYLPSAEQQLADLWLAAADRSAITSASDKIDQLLKDNPLAVGESRVSNIRILFEEPLVVVYDVREADLVVKVWAVWQWKSQ
jgi:hypothetical protein